MKSTTPSKKISLIFPPPSQEYADVMWSAKDAPSPPQTASAELAAYVKHYSTTPITVQGINPQTIKDGKICYHTIDEITQLCLDSEIIGLTCLYHNQQTAQDIAQSIKKTYPTKIIIFGGQNVSNKFMASLILNQIPAVDYVVLGDGEDTLTGLVNNLPLKQIPNLAYRNHHKIIFTPRKSVDLNKIPLWDYDNVIDAKILLEAHDSRTSKYQELVQQYKGRTLGEIAVFSQRGCAKAQGEVGQMKGACKFCTSSGLSTGKMSPDHFWHQLELLTHKYGIIDYFILDNVFGTDLSQLQQFQTSRQKFDIPQNVEFRAYTYPSIIMSSDGKKIAQQLKELGVNNLFVGVETFDSKISLLANKDPVSYKIVETTIKILADAGIDTFIPFMPGLPGESKESLHTNLEYLEQLLQKYSSKEYGKGHLTRVDISPATPLVGTAWYAQLVSNSQINSQYHQQTGKFLQEDITPNFEILRNLSLQHYSTVTENDVKEFAISAKKMCVQYMKPEMVGGFDLRQSDIK